MVRPALYAAATLTGGTSPLAASSFCRRTSHNPSAKNGSARQAPTHELPASLRPSDVSPA